MIEVVSVLGEIISKLKDNNINPLHVIFNTNYIDEHNKISEFLMDSAKGKEILELHDNDFLSSMCGVPCSYLLLGLPNIFFIILTDDPMVSPAIATNELGEEELDKYKSDYVM